MINTKIYILFLSIIFFIISSCHNNGLYKGSHMYTSSGEDYISNDDEDEFDMKEAKKEQKEFIKEMNKNKKEIEKGHKAFFKRKKYKLKLKKKGKNEDNENL